MYLKNKYTKWYYSIIERAKSRELDENIYSERHHIIPKSIGGSNCKNNLVKLTAREHRLVHILLPKMTISQEHTKKMWYAAWMMLRVENKMQDRVISKGKFYELSKLKFQQILSERHKGKLVSNSTRKKMSESRKGQVSPFKGKSHTAETKQHLSDSRTGKTHSPETIAKILDSRKHYKHSDETKQKISNSNQGRSTTISEETKQKISNTLKGRKPTWLMGKPSATKGVPRSEETKEKLKIAAANREQVTCPHCGKIAPKCSYARWHGNNCKNLKN